MTSIAQEIQECISEKLPSFVYVVPCGANGPMNAEAIDDIVGAIIYFLDQNRHAIDMRPNGPIHKLSYRVDKLSIPILKVHLKNIMPEKVLIIRKRGWLIPVEETSTNSDANNIRLWIHNLMFWESLTANNQVGPLANSILRHKQLISKIDEQTNAARTVLRSGRYLRSQAALGDMFNMIVALKGHIDRLKHNASNNGDAFEGNINSRIEATNHLMAALYQTQNEVQMIQERLIMQMKELQELFNSEEK